MCRNIAQSPLEAQFQLPCYMLTVLDCFSEGGYFFPYEDYDTRTHTQCVCVCARVCVYVCECVCVR